MNELAELLGESPAIETLRQALRRLLNRPQAGRRRPPVLLQGATGTGKGLVARLIHRAGPRADAPFVDVNCAAIPDSLFEAELFGFERGAFTDAARSKRGLFQTAHHGTIFLDEIGLLPDGMQAKLLTVLEEQAVRRLGSTTSEPVDVAIISATNLDLREEVAARRFREDLFHRLAVFTFDLPPLRERGRDILLLAERFLGHACADYGLAPKHLLPAAAARLLAHSWPGNVRELANVMERVAVLGDAAAVGVDMLELAEPTPTRFAAISAPTGPGEREKLLRALEETGWNISQTATRLDLTRNTVRARIKRFGLLRRGTNDPGAAGLEVETPEPSIPPLASAAVPTAPPAPLRWHRRRITFLRTTLAPTDLDETRLTGTRVLDTIVQKVLTFGGDIDEIGPSEIGAVFGLEPIEDGPRRAAHVATAVQRAGERGYPEEGGPFGVKSAIHVGEVLVAFLSGGSEIEANTRRESWGAADRILEQAETGTIVVTAAAVPFLERRFLIGQMRDSVDGYELCGRERPGLAPEGQMADFVGRRAELGLLNDRRAAARAGRGQVVTIVGEAGIGKSRLVHEFRQILRKERVLYLETHCASYGIGVPYYPIIDLLRQGCHLLDTDSAERARQKLVDVLRRLELPAGEILPHLMHLLGHPMDSERPGTSTPDEIRERTAEVLHRMCASASLQRPLVLVIEDLQWIDPASENLRSMFEALSNRPLLLVLTYRPDYPAARLDQFRATQISLQPLGEEESRRLLHGILPSNRLPDTIIREILDRADGNPFFLEELGRTFREGGSPSARYDVPHTVQEVLLARINRLPERERGVLQSAAAIGRKVPLSLLAAIAEPEGRDLAASLSLLRTGEFLQQTSVAPEVELTFKHALTHQVTYDGIDHRRRRVLHARIVAAIEQLYPERLADLAERLADHALLGDVRDKAVDYLRLAGARAFARGGVEESLDRFEKALSLTEGLPDTPDNGRRAIDARLDLHSPLIVLGQVDRLIRLHQESEAIARRVDDPPRRGQVLWRMAHYSWMDARYRDGITCAEQALDIASATGNATLRVAAMFASALNRFSLGLYREAMRSFEDLADGPDAEIARRLLALTVPAYVSSCGWLGHCWSFLGDPRRGLTYARRAEQAADASNHPQAQAISYTLGALPLIYMGNLAQGVEQAERALELCKSRGLILWFPGASVTYGWALALAGRATEALPHLEAGTFVEMAGRRNFLSLMYVWWAEGLLLAGKHDDATQKIARAIELAKQCHEDGYLSEALLGSARILASAEPLRLEPAVAAYHDASQHAERLGQRALLARVQLGLGQLYRRARRAGEARAHLRTAAAELEAMGLGLWLAEAEAALNAES